MNDLVRGGLLRPQPLGVLPLPAGALLLPDVPGAAEVAQQLARGRTPTTWPDGLAFYAAAVDGDVDRATALLDEALQGATSGAVGDGLVLRVDRFVLAPTAEAHGALSAALDAAGADAPEHLRVLLDAAAFVAGVTDVPPALPVAGDRGAAGDPNSPGDEGPDGELRAAVLVARAADALEHGGPSGVAAAGALLAEAVEHCVDVVPATAAQLLGTLGSLAAGQGRDADAVALYTRAAGLLGPGTLPLARAELHYGRAVALQSVAGSSPAPAAVLKEAVRCYQQALVVFRRESHPELFAEAQTNLALAYLATPMVDAGDHLRLGIAVQALRDALDVWQRATHPQQWASVTLNLANALQYLPSVHQEDNLAEAVELYEELLEVRDPGRDPVGVARVLAGQGNALAHLGILDHAAEKLIRARELFAAAGDAASAAALGDTLAEVGTLTPAGAPRAAV